MKKLLLLAAIVAASCFAASGQYRDSEDLAERLEWNNEKLHIMLDTRFDARGDAFRPGNKELGFRGPALRLWLHGEIVPGIRYRLRHKLNRAQDPLYDGLANTTEHMWIAFDLGARKDWTITVGKQSIALGTFEYDYNPADLYISSMFNSTLDNHQIGVNVAHTFLGQTVNVQVFNGGSEQFAAADYRNKSLGVSIMWQGDFLNGALRTRTGYTAVQHTKTKLYNWVTTGWQINVSKFTAELDYYFGDRNMDYSTLVPETGARPVRDHSAAANFKYNGGRWRPFVKGTWDQRNDRSTESTVYDTFGIQAVVEWYPFMGHRYISDLRFHAAYGYTTTSFRNQWSSQPTLGHHMLMIGMRWFFDAK